MYIHLQTNALRLRSEIFVDWLLKTSRDMYNIVQYMYTWIVYKWISHTIHQSLSTILQNIWRKQEYDYAQTSFEMRWDSHKHIFFSSLRKSVDGFNMKSTKQPCFSSHPKKKQMTICLTKSKTSKMKAAVMPYIQNEKYLENVLFIRFLQNHYSTDRDFGSFIQPRERVLLRDVDCIAADDALAIALNTMYTIFFPH